MNSTELYQPTQANMTTTNPTARVISNTRNCETDRHHII